MLRRFALGLTRIARSAKPTRSVRGFRTARSSRAAATSHRFAPMSLFFRSFASDKKNVRDMTEEEMENLTEEELDQLTEEELDMLPQFKQPGNEQYTGKAAIEYKIDQEGEELYGTENPSGPFGTMENPVKIYSYLGERQVGCVGSRSEPHELAWFNLREGPKHICTICGQVFELVDANKEMPERNVA